jgi:hypothetical protein
MKYKIFFLMLFLAVILGCSKAVIYIGEIKSENTEDLINVSRSLDAYFIGLGFAVNPLYEDIDIRYNDPCSFAYDATLCNLGLNSSWKKWSDDKKKSILFVGIRLDKDKVKIGLVPGRDRNYDAVYYGEELKKFLGSNYSENSYELVRIEEPDIFR